MPLRRIKRRNDIAFYWYCPEAARAQGYPRKTAPLRDMTEEEAREKALRLDQAALLWAASQSGSWNRPFDGSLAHLIDLYRNHEESSWHGLKPGTRKLYNIYLDRSRAEVGTRRIGNISGLDLLRWHRAWSNEGQHRSAARMALKAIQSAARFGVLSRLRDCEGLLLILRELRIGGTKPRTAVITAEQVVSLRKAAHARQRPSLALLYAFQYETGLRLWDCAALQWSQVKDNVLTTVPTKTEDTTSVRVLADLPTCPMVMEELEHYSRDRIGPIIVNEGTGKPYSPAATQWWWRRLTKDVGLPPSIWNRDLRASAVTEARQAGAATDDVAKVAGHSTPRVTAQVYDRAALEAQRRVAEARRKHRSK